MKIRKILLFVMSIALCTVSMAADDEAQGPRMTFLEKHFDFGEIVTGEVVEHVYAFTNTGTDTLRIATVYSS